MSDEAAPNLLSLFGPWNRSGASGAASGMNGKALRDLALGWPIIVGLLATATVVNALTVQADEPQLRGWEAWALEGTSTTMLALLGWIPWLTITIAPPEGAKKTLAWGRRLAAHLAGALLFSALHVGGMLSLRYALYSAAGEIYRYGAIGSRFLYEFRKDLLTYTVLAAIFWLLRRRRELAPRPVSFDIHDGARLIRTSSSEILAVAAAGNYVEFVLADGRRPLMRTTMRSVEAALAPLGFVRTHRSWLINSRRVKGLRPLGAGDWSVELDGAVAPLSRRYPGALARLRRGEP